jgi:hypothetical protein
MIPRCYGRDVTREAVVQGFETFIGDAIDESMSEFSISRVLQSGVRGPGSAVVDSLMENSGRLHSRVVEPELETYRQQAYDQFSLILDYAESDEDIEAYRDDILSTGALERDIRDDLDDERRQEVLDYMLSRHKGLGDAVVPLIDSPEETFWDAAVAEMDVETSRDLVRRHFAYTQPIREYPEAFRFATTVDTSDVLGMFGSILGGSTIEVEYTDEAFRALTVAEENVIESVMQDIDRHFDEAESVG